MEIEQHPLEPFLPGNARLLMLGSFPPQKKRWSMEFYYPNWNNDMWRITGFLFFNDKDYFVDKYNPQNEMFRLLGTKRSFSQNETFFFSHPYPALFRLISHF